MQEKIKVLENKYLHFESQKNVSNLTESNEKDVPKSKEKINKDEIISQLRKELELGAHQKQISQTSSDLTSEKGERTNSVVSTASTPRMSQSRTLKCNSKKSPQVLLKR